VARRRAAAAWGPWQEQLETALTQVRTTAVLVGATGLGPWQEAEMRAAIDESVRRNLPVIPVLLPGAPDRPQLPLFLRAFTWVDLRRGVTAEGLDRLQWGILGEKPGVTGARAQAPRGSLRHNLPLLSLGALFTGREQELLDLAADLDAAGSAAVGQDRLVSGLGGVGKTRLAVEYGWRYGGRYTAVLFVRADSPIGLRRGLAGLAAAELLDLPERQGAPEQEVIGAVLRRLVEAPGWLLILDNADSEEAAAAVQEVLPRLSAGHVLITSRRTRWGWGLGGQALGALAAADAARFLDERTAGRRARRPDDADAAERLARLLGGLPLALAQAAAFIARRRLSFSDYLDAWAGERERVLAWYDPLVMEYPEPVAVTWQRSFEALGPAAAALLRLVAFLAPDPVQVALVEKGSGLVAEACRLLCGETGQPEPGEAVVREALADLDALSLIAWAEESFTVHALVQEVVRGRIPAERRREWTRVAVELVLRYAPDSPGDVRTWAVWDLLRPHAAQVLACAAAAGDPEPAAVLMNQLALLFKAKALYRQSEPLQRRALAIGEARLGPDHPEVAIRLNNLALLLQATNRLEEAEPLMRRALAIDEASFGANHPDVAIDLNNLAQLLKATNRLEAAEPLMLRALAIDEASFGPDHPNVARDLNNLAQLLQATNRLEEAEPLIRRALAIDEASFGPGHPEVALRLNNLARLLQATNRLEAAEPLMRRALAVAQPSLGEDHPNTATIQANLEALLRVLASRS
jgi:tetratricopeptide (TPR) repeat protein